MNGDGEQCSPGYNGDKCLEIFQSPYGQQDEQSEANRYFNGLCHRVRVSVSFITHGDSSAAMDWNDTLLQIIMWVEPPRLYPGQISGLYTDENSQALHSYHIVPGPGDRLGRRKTG